MAKSTRCNNACMLHRDCAIAPTRYDSTSCCVCAPSVTSDDESSRMNGLVRTSCPGPTRGRFEHIAICSAYISASLRLIMTSNVPRNLDHSNHGVRYLDCLHTHWRTELTAFKVNQTYYFYLKWSTPLSLSALCHSYYITCPLISFK